MNIVCHKLIDPNKDIIGVCLSEQLCAYRIPSRLFLPVHVFCVLMHFYQDKDVAAGCVCVFVLACVSVFMYGNVTCTCAYPPTAVSVSPAICLPLCCADLRICLCLVTLPLLLIDFSIYFNQLLHLSPPICCHITVSLINPQLKLTAQAAYCRLL